MDFEKEYLDACMRVSDINEHLPTLSDLTSECNHVTEMGVCTGQSTRAFLRHNITYVGYDSVVQPGMNEFFEDAKKTDRNITFNVASTTEVEIEPTDLLFIDTLHNYGQLQRELELHGNKARKFIVFHDTTLFETRDETGGGQGLWPAIQEFIDAHPEWMIHKRYTNNNGLTVLRRMN